MTRSMRRDERLRAVVRVLRSQQDLAQSTRDVTAAVAEPAWLLASLERHRLAPLWYDAVRSQPALHGLLPGDLRERLSSLQRGAAAAAMLQKQLARVASEALNSRGIAHAFFKGVHLRCTVYRAASLRPADDVDLLVEPAHRLAARQALLEHGFSYVKKASPLTHEESLVWRGSHLDLHWSLFRPGRSRFEPANEVIAAAHDMHDLRVPCPQHALVIGLLATALGDYVTGRLIRAVDVDLLVRQFSPSWDGVVDLTDRLGLKPAAWITLSWVQNWLHTPVPREVLQALAPGPLRRRYLRAWLDLDPWQVYHKSPGLARVTFSLALQQRGSDALRAAVRRAAVPFDAPQRSSPDAVAPDMDVWHQRTVTNASAPLSPLARPDNAERTTQAEQSKAQRIPHRQLVLVHVVTVPLSLRFLVGQTRFMRERAYRVHAVSSAGPMLDEFAARESAVPHVLALTRDINPLTDAVQLAKLWWLLTRLRPDIVHAHTPKGGLLGTVAARLAGVPVRIYHARGLRLATMKGATRLLLTTTERVACALATDVICNSHSLRQEFERLRLGSPKKLRVLLQGSGNGVDLQGRFNRFRLPDDVREQVRERHGIPTDALLVGFVGRIVRDKGIVELCQAWREIQQRFPNARLMLVGPYDATDPIPDETRRELETDSRIHLVPFTEDVAEYYAAMDLFVLPSYREGFANALLEAGAMGLASVTTRVTGCTDPIVDGSTGTLVPARDAESLRAAIERYLGDPELRALHAAAARQRIEHNYRQEPLWNALEDLYQEARHRPRQFGWKLVVKQTLDKLVAGALLLLTAPVMGVTALSIAVSMGRPVVFTQTRVGRNDETFQVIKFRTMLDQRDARGQLLSDGERLTKLGRFIRSLSLDELPQLINILRGEMSLVGPRPLLVKYLERYTPEQARRHTVLPGVTGWTAVRGRNSLDWETRFAHDNWYVDHWSLWLDAEILLRTIVAVIRREGITEKNHATISEFMGNQV